MITAHSGCDHTQDNSLDFIRYALSLSVDAFEVDVRKNVRGELILSHDETDEIAPLLSEAFEMLREHPEKKINCDLKQNHIESDVVFLAKQYGVDHQLIFTGSVDPELFKKRNAVFPQVVWYSNISTLLPNFGAWQRTGVTDAQITQRLEQLLLQMKDYETAGLNWHYTDAERVWKKARELGVGISVWTVNDREQQEIWLARKAENITSRHITQLIALRESR